VAQTGTIGGTHHLTMCVGSAQEDYDFHVRVLGLRSVKKTVLFDGELPVYHLYYGNDVGDVSTLLTSFPYRQAGWMGERGTNQAKQINLAVPAASIGWWSDHLLEHGITTERIELFGTERLLLAHPCGIPNALVGENRPPAGDLALRRGHDPPSCLRRDGRSQPGHDQGLAGRPWLHRHL
jgi:glyoxalase family protein